GVPAADEHERQRRLAGRRVARGGRDVEPVDHLVAQVDRLAYGLEADRLFAQAGDRQGTGDAAGREHDLVVPDLPGRPDDRLYRGHLPGVLDPDHLAGQDVAAAQ